MDRVQISKSFIYAFRLIHSDCRAAPVAANSFYDNNSGNSECDCRTQGNPNPARHCEKHSVFADKFHWSAFWRGFCCLSLLCFFSATLQNVLVLHPAHLALANAIVSKVIAFAFSVAVIRKTQVAKLVAANAGNVIASLVLRDTSAAAWARPQRIRSLWLKLVRFRRFLFCSSFSLFLPLPLVAARSQTPHHSFPAPI